MALPFGIGASQNSTFRVCVAINDSLNIPLELTEAGLT